MRRRAGAGDWVVLCIAIPLAPIWIPALCVLKTYRCLRAEPPPAEREYISRTKTRPKRLPYTRNTNLTQLQLPPDTVNTTSPLLALPYSVRLQIYSYLLANRYIIHLFAPPNRLAHSHNHYPDNWCSNQHLRASPSASIGTIPNSVLNRPHNLPLNLLKTCRQVYQECIPLLYGTNTFDTDDLNTLIFFNQCVRPQHLAQIRYLQITWNMWWTPFVDHLPATSRPHDTETWVRFWNIVATRLTGLKGLDVTVRVFRSGFADEKLWCEPITKIRGLEYFILKIKYPEGGWGIGMLGDEGVAYRKELERCVGLPRERENFEAVELSAGTEGNLKAVETKQLAIVQAQVNAPV